MQRNLQDSVIPPFLLLYFAIVSLVRATMESTYKNLCKGFVRFDTIYIMSQFGHVFVCNHDVYCFRRQDKEPSASSRLCSCHFKDGLKANGPSIFERNAAKRFAFDDPEKR